MLHPFCLTAMQCHGIRIPHYPTPFNKLTMRSVLLGIVFLDKKGNETPIQVAIIVFTCRDYRSICIVLIFLIDRVILNTF